jgi:hypothetical protein
MFEVEKAETESIYSKTTAKNLIYEPSQRKPDLREMVDRCKTKELEAAIERAEITVEEKLFLTLAKPTTPQP